MTTTKPTSKNVSNIVNKTYFYPYIEPELISAYCIKLFLDMYNHFKQWTDFGL